LADEDAAAVASDAGLRADGGRRTTTLSALVLVFTSDDSRAEIGFATRIPSRCAFRFGTSSLDVNLRAGLLKKPC
jgi:hypothetical protein